MKKAQEKKDNPDLTTEQLREHSEKLLRAANDVDTMKPMDIPKIPRPN